MLKITLQSLPLILLLLTSAMSQAATIPVNYFASDLADMDGGIGVCDALPDPTWPGPQCTLRAAIQTANLLPGPDIITIPTDSIITLTIPAGGASSAAHGDLDITEALTIQASGGFPLGDARPLIQANGSGRIFTDFGYSGGGEIIIQGLRLANGTADFGGALRVGAAMVTVTNVEMFANQATDSGGAIFILSLGDLTLEQVNIYGNLAINEGNAIWNNSGELTISQSSIHSNPAGAPEAIRSSGAGITSIVDSTISGNIGDGVSIENSQSLFVRNSTIVGNSGYGILFEANDVEELNIRNSIIGDNDDGGCRIPPGTAPIVNTNSYNLYQDDDSCNMSTGATNIAIVGGLGLANVGLGPLTGTGNAYTEHHMPLPGSAAIDNGDPSDPGSGGNACTTTDQRGIARPLDGNGNAGPRCDIGAIEAPAVALIPEIFADGFED